MSSMNTEIKNHWNIANLSNGIQELKYGAFVLGSCFDSLALEYFLAVLSNLKKINIKALSSRNLNSSREDKSQTHNCIKYFKMLTRNKSVMFLWESWRRK